MKHFLSSLLIVFACGYASAQSTSIEGNWGTQFQENGLKFDLTFSIRKNLTTITNVCSLFDRTATAQVTARSTYTDSTFTILEAKRSQVSENGLDCHVSTEPDTMRYSVQGDQLIFIREGSPDTLVLNKK